MDTYLNIGKSILQDYFNYYCEESLDDAEYIPVVKVIIDGITKSMDSEHFKGEDIQNIKETLKEFNRDLYVANWLKQTKEDEGSLDSEGETESATYYFDYIYEHGEHPH